MSESILPATQLYDGIPSLRQKHNADIWKA